MLPSLHTTIYKQLPVLAVSYLTLVRHKEKPFFAWLLTWLCVGSPAYMYEVFFHSRLPALATCSYIQSIFFQFMCRFLTTAACSYTWRFFFGSTCVQVVSKLEMLWSYFSLLYKRCTFLPLFLYYLEVLNYLINANKTLFCFAVSFGISNGRILYSPFKNIKSFQIGHAFLLRTSMRPLKWWHNGQLLFVLGKKV